MYKNPLQSLSNWRNQPGASGIVSICTAHPIVIEAAMRAIMPTSLALLIEATCNQVNQDGGYTGMTPLDYRQFVLDIAQECNFPPQRLIFGGDHLGPNPWKHLPAEQAMAKAEIMIRAYSAAGFSKLHLDCSMGCLNEPLALDDELIAKRAAYLAKAAEEARDKNAIAPVYIIGTEVPVPGGALEEIEGLQVTDKNAALKTYAIHKQAFHEQGLDDAFNRVIGLVVQPGVEFGNHNVIDYDPPAAQDLCSALKEMPNIVFEAHSTDYQTPKALAALVHDGFAILKVGPKLTFVMRETLYGLDMIANELFAGKRQKTLRQTMEEVMLAAPANWDRYYHGNAQELALQRHFSYSDRIRYYWPDPKADAAIQELLTLLDKVDLPETLIGQYLGSVYDDIRAQRLAANAKAVLFATIEKAINDYIAACYHA